MVKLNYIFIVLALLLVLPLVDANLGTFKQNDCVGIRVLANCTGINLTEVTHGQITEIINSDMGNLAGQTFNYSFCNTSDLGTYTYSWNNVCVDCSVNECGNGFLVTANGKEPPSGAVITIFIILFLIVLLIATYLIIYSFGHGLSLDFDIMDLAWNYGIFFVLVGMKLLQDNYLGNTNIDNFLTWGIDIGIFVAIILPTIYFILTLTVGSIMKKRIRGVDFGN